MDTRRSRQYEDYIASVSPMAAAIGHREPYHLAYLRRHGCDGPVPAGRNMGAGEEAKDLVQVVCDRCGVAMPASGKIGYIAWNFRDGLDGDLAGGNILEGRHYCKPCMDSIMEHISAAPSGTGKDAGRPDQAEGKKRRVDTGKILALKDAGWNARKIADDMGISLQSVYNVLRRHGRGGEDGSDG